jgi:hypothetical protein
MVCNIRDLEPQKVTDLRELTAGEIDLVSGAGGHHHHHHHHMSTHSGPASSFSIPAISIPGISIPAIGIGSAQIAVGIQIGIAIAIGGGLASVSNQQVVVA